MTTFVLLGSEKCYLFTTELDILYVLKVGLHILFLISMQKSN